ncbi:MAG: UvrD-helicase domain-containing protein [Clostridia bacterium]|nr:UvrD-helicase domain-containing protein [Clostridia bacterium]
MYTADLHIHSRFSRATSRDLEPRHLELWGRHKGIGLIGTGDLTHAAWRQELREMLEPAEGGLYTLKEELRLPCTTKDTLQPRFVVSGEISTIYKRDGKTRKVHHVILLPGLDEADVLARRLEAVGNIHSDGRPILGLDSRDLLEIVLESCPDAIYIPAHIWTPHFSLFGAFSGFDTVEECYGDLARHVHAMETGLSSDPAMNRCLSMLDGYQLVSSSDAHSPAKLGREATLLEGESDYRLLKRAIETGEGLAGTIEFFPEEGKYHLDGHRACHCRLEPEETAAYGGKCPVCGKRITVGVLSRVRQLADRHEPVLRKPYESLIPLPELLGECLGVGAASKRTEKVYMEMLARLGPELSILRTVPTETIETVAGPVVAEAIRRLRQGKVHCLGGYDGEYGTIRVYEDGEVQEAGGQTSLLDALGLRTAPRSGKKAAPQLAPSAPAAPAILPDEPAPRQAELNEQQSAAVHSQARTTAVIAGPGTGKTKTLIARILYLLQEKGVSPKEITAVTFTRQAARELKERLENAVGKKALKGITVGTFHSVALSYLPKRSIADRSTRLLLMGETLHAFGEKMSPAAALDALSAQKNGRPTRLSPGIAQSYGQRLEDAGLRDLDDVLLEALETDTSAMPCFRHLLVDEFQDINAVQHRLVRHWCGQTGTLFVIGDPDQSIYGFRGADADCFDRLLKEQPDAQVISLQENYRSAEPVLDCALSLISCNPGIPRSLSAQRGSGVPVRLAQAGDTFSEGAWIASEITAMVGGTDMLTAHSGRYDREEPRAFSEIAVLARTHRQLEQIEAALRRQDIPCTVFGGGHFWEDKSVQGLLGFFRWLREPENLSALRDALIVLWKIPEPLISQAQASAQVSLTAAGTPDAALLRTTLAPFDVLNAFVEAVETHVPHAASGQPAKMLEQLASQTVRKGRAVEQLLNAAVFHKRMDAFLDTLTTGEEADLRRRSGQEKRSGAVSLMTLHASKGLEFPVVFVAGVNEGELPLERDGEECNIEEERRLFFVGLTRAKEELVITCGGEPSAFLGQLSPTVECISLPRRQPILRTEQLSLF